MAQNNGGSILMSNKILAVMSHPDDEIIYGWPVLQHAEFDRYLLMCSSGVKMDRLRRMKALTEVCRKENITLLDALPLPDFFYRLTPTNRYNNKTYAFKQAVKMIRAAILKAICEIKPDMVFTHNPFGEYGHGDHQLVHYLVTTHEHVSKVSFTDVRDKGTGRHIELDNMPAFYNKTIYGNSDLIVPETLDADFYIRNKHIYEEYNAWTWLIQEPPTYPKPNCKTHIFNLR